MLGYNRVTEAIAKAKCCLPKLGAKKFRALSRSECTDNSFLKVSLALDTLQGYIPDGATLFTIPVYAETIEIDNNPVYTGNDPALKEISMNFITFNGRYNINNAITRFFSTVDMTVHINGVLIGSQNGVSALTIDDYVVAASDIINNSGHDYTAIAGGTKLTISQPVKNNTLRSGQNNSGAFKNTYEVDIQASGVYPMGMCDYGMSFPVGDYLSQITFIKFKGISVDGIYSNFQSEISWLANYPYGDPLYDFGLQKQIDLVLNPGNVIYTPVITLDPSGQILQGLDLTIQAVYNTVDFIRIEIDSPNYGGSPVEIDYGLTPENCGTGFFTILFQNGNNVNPILENGNYLLGEPPRKCTYGMAVVSDNISDAINAIDINGVRYYFSSKLPLNNPSAIQSELESLTSSLGITWEVMYDDTNNPSVFTIRQTNYSFNVPDAVSYIINGIENVRPFEKLSCIVFNETNYSVTQSDDTQCMQESSVEKAIAEIESHCCGCDEEQTTPIYPNLINVLEGDNSNSMITDDNNNPIET